MYSNDLTQISQGFDNFIGALITSINASPSASKQAIAEILCNKLMTIIEADNNTVDMYVAKPYIKSIISFLSKRKESLAKLKGTVNNKNIDMILNDYEQVIVFFKNILSKADGGEIK